MKIDGQLVNGWHQPSMFNDDVYTFTLRVGVYPAEGHIQAEIEVTDARSGDLIALQSWPALEGAPVYDRLGLITKEFLSKLADAIDPF